MTASLMPLPVGESGPHWYRSAVVYEVFVRGFFDMTADGNGDLFLTFEIAEG